MGWTYIRSLFAVELQLTMLKLPSVQPLFTIRSLFVSLRQKFDVGLDSVYWMIWMKDVLQYFHAKNKNNIINTIK
jgi:hypothetical protein